MKIISHRGYWTTESEKNTLSAFTRSFSLGYGTETDIRDHKSELIISHDIPVKDEIFFDKFLSIAQSYSPITLALNIKSDGLASHIVEKLKPYPTLDYFCFDMSVPDMRSYISNGIPFFTRMSEVERDPVWADHADGIWLDAFYSEWYSIDMIKKILDLNKRVCIVSSELHGRCNKELWTKLLPLTNESRLIICTDFPEKATAFFNLGR